MFTADKKIAIAKFVAPDFQEKHRHEWKQPHPTPTDFVQHLIGEGKALHPFHRPNQTRSSFWIAGVVQDQIAI